MPLEWQGLGKGRAALQQARQRTGTTWAPKRMTRAPERLLWALLALLLVELLLPHLPAPYNAHHCTRLDYVRYGVTGSEEA